MDLDRDDEATRVRAWLRERFAPDAGDVRRLAGGEFSRAFAFTSGGGDYVIRLNAAAHAAEGFAKDDYAWRQFASPALPIPRAVATGRTADECFSISERAAGRTLKAFSPAERRALLPATLDTLDAIGRADVSASRGYGDWGGDGDGRFASWRGYLAAIFDNEAEGYYQDWHALFRESFLEREVYEVVYRRMLRLAERCPEERALIHNDYWYENILADGERITGVIDWANALYGDPLYDVARLSWGSGWPGWWHEDGEALLRARYGAAPGYAERVACYECHFGLDDLRFYAKTGRRAEYQWARDRLLARAAADPGDA
jgi:hygromycin-B 4-O-kinase